MPWPAGAARSAFTWSLARKRVLEQAAARAADRAGVDLVAADA